MDPPINYSVMWHKNLLNSTERQGLKEIYGAPSQQAVPAINYYGAKRKLDLFSNLGFGKIEKK
jgi:hypothetical protein